VVLRKKWNGWKSIELQQLIRTGEICRHTCAQFGNILADIKSSGPQNALTCRQIDWKQCCVIKIIYRHLFKTVDMNWQTCTLGYWIKVRRQKYATLVRISSRSFTRHITISCHVIIFRVLFVFNAYMCVSGTTLLKINSINQVYCKPNPLVARSKSWIWGRSPAKIAVSNPAGGWISVYFCVLTEVSATGRSFV